MKHELRLASLEAPPNPWGIQLAADLQRIEFLRDKFAGEIGDDFFDKIVEVDPTNNKKYVQWMATRAKQGVLDQQDLPDLEGDLIVFDKMLRTKKLKGPDRDLNRLKTPMDLFDLVEPYRDEESRKEKEKREKERIRKDISVVYDGPLGLILSPGTHEAACYVGRWTKWCTTENDPYHYNDYAERGDLYVVVPKKKKYKGEKYQIFLDRNRYGYGEYYDEEGKPVWEFKDEQNEDAYVSEFRGDHPELFLAVTKAHVLPSEEDDKGAVIDWLTEDIGRPEIATDFLDIDFEDVWERVYSRLRPYPYGGASEAFAQAIQKLSDETNDPYSVFRDLGQQRKLIYEYPVAFLSEASIYPDVYAQKQAPIAYTSLVFPEKRSKGIGTAVKSDEFIGINVYELLYGDHSIHRTMLGAMPRKVLKKIYQKFPKKREEHEESFKRYIAEDPARERDFKKGLKNYVNFFRKGDSRTLLDAMLWSVANPDLLKKKWWA